MKVGEPRLWLCRECSSVTKLDKELDTCTRCGSDNLTEAKGGVVNRLRYIRQKLVKRGEYQPVYARRLAIGFARLQGALPE